MISHKTVQSYYPMETDMQGSAAQKVFTVEGNIGAGKSTFLRLIEKQLPVQIVYEPLDQWQAVEGQDSLLDLFYRDTKRWAYTFQTYAFVTRVKHQEACLRKNRHPYQIVERSVYSDRYCFAQNCFEMGTLSQLEWTPYKEWFEWLVEQYTVRPSGFIYLQTDPEICYKRLHKRGRKEESEVSLGYLQALHQKHEDWLIKKRGVAPYLENVPVLVLDCNNDFELSPDRLQNHLEAVAHFIGVTLLSKESA